MGKLDVTFIQESMGLCDELCNDFMEKFLHWVFQGLNSFGHSRVIIIGIYASCIFTNCFTIM